MNKELLCDMFVHTGKVEYYIKYKELENESNKGRTEV
jgi:hypothetical protein